jgi:hypothetical protein
MLSLGNRNEPVWAVEHGRVVGEHRLALAENVSLEVLARLPLGATCASQ